MSRRIAATLLLTCSCAVGSLEGGLLPAQDELLLRTASQYSQGFLEDAWDALIEFHSHPKRNNVDYGLFGICFIMGHCPHPSQLAEVLGKTRGDIQPLKGFCPEWADRPETPPLGAESWQDYWSWHRAKGFFAPSCEEWYERIESETIAAPPIGRVAPARTEIKLEWRERNGAAAPRPMVTAMLASETSQLALVDTGSTMAIYFLRWQSPDSDTLRTHHLNLGFKLLRPDLTLVSSLGRIPISVYRFPEPFYVGGAAYSRVSGSILDPRDFPWGRESDFIANMTVPQSLLLRHQAVCFDWANSVLLLGDVKPCRSGVSVDAALRLGLSINLSIPTRIRRNEEAAYGFPGLQRLDRMEALLDTGSDWTICSESFVALNGGDIEFSLSASGELTAVCSRVVRWHPSFGHDLGYGGPNIAIIGMDTLLKFQAFGWELNPLRFYVVPYEDSEASPDPIPGR